MSQERCTGVVGWWFPKSWRYPQSNLDHDLVLIPMVTWVLHTSGWSFQCGKWLDGIASEAGESLHERWGPVGIAFVQTWGQWGPEMRPFLWEDDFEKNNLLGGLEHFLFSTIYGMFSSHIISTDELHHFSEGWNHQPDSMVFGRMN